ncbi:MAG: N-acetyl-gamma-glutamyl-phosphate reductase [Leptospiraceae bacterium]|nr:N-acetyl-gamma-glutamyl-phosphate reductase [Leptospiraceae bacterium]
MIEVSIFGAAGLTGRELLTWLRHHPSARPVFLTSDQHAGRSVAQVFPELSEYNNLHFSRHEDTPPTGSLVFLATPNQTSMDLAPALLERGHKVIDLSGAFRIPEQPLFERFYGIEHTCFSLVSEAVYGMPELFREQIRNAQFISNPGCYPTGSIIPLHFLKEAGGRIRQVIVDAKSGVSGAGGRTEDAGFAFQNVYENFRAYKVLKHQHTPEIQIYGADGPRFQSPDEAKNTPILVFTPHLLPIYRGILSTIFVEWEESPSSDPATSLKGRSTSEPFVRYLESPEAVELKKTQHTNFVDFSARSMGHITMIVSAIDNLVKGAAGQAIQNMNLMEGLPETEGLLARTEVMAH